MTNSPTIHFKLHELADGVYAAVAAPGGAAYSNAGIIDLGDQTLVFDTFDQPQAAEDLRDAAERLTGRPPTVVINSHQHSDHWGGNQLFVDAPIIASHVAREAMPAQAAELTALQADPSPLEQQQAQVRDMLDAEKDPRRQAEIRRQLRRLTYLLEALPMWHPTCPTASFDREMRFYGADRRAELAVPGHRRTPYVAHTPGDCFLTLPEEGILFAGDLAFFGRQPYMGDSDPSSWRSALLMLEAAPYEVVVPGHGPLGGRADLELERDYIATLEGMVKEALAAGEDVEALLNRQLPEPFNAWSVDGAPSEPNVRALYRRFAA